jgi:translocation and assembly module TamB
LKRIALGLLAVLLLAALVLAALAALLASDGGVRWLADRAAGSSGGRLVMQQVSGHLGTPLGVGKLVVVTDTQRITLDRLRLVWKPRALLQRRLDIALIAAQTVTVETLKPGPPATLPTRLRLPFELRIAAWDVAQLVLIHGGQTLTFSALHGTLDGVGDRYQLRASATTPWANANADFALGKDAPFKLHGRLDATRATSLPVRARLDLDGTLAAIGFNADARAQGMQFQANGEVAPFAAIVLPRLVLVGQGIDPQQFVAGAPRARFAFSGLFEGRPGERLLGTFSLSNQIPGRFDEGRVPLANLAGAVLGDAARADFSSLALDLGAAGQFSGSGHWRDATLALDIASSSVDLAALHQRLYPTRLRTWLQLSASATRQTLVADLAERWGQGRLSLSLANSVLRLDDAAFSGEGGRLAASGSLALDASRAFVARIDAANINPARFGKFPRAQLNARGDARGTLAPALTVQTQFSLPPGQLEGRPVQGQGRLRYEKNHLVNADIELDLAGNRARLKGAYGRVGDRFDWRVDAPELARLNLGLGGQLQSQGSVSGDPQQPQISVSFAGGKLRLPGGVAVLSVAGKLQLQAAAHGVFAGEIDARGVQYDTVHIDAVTATLRGRRAAHTLAFDARLPQGSVRASLTGGLDATQRWRGQLVNADVLGRWPLHLVAPAALQLARDRQQVDQLAFTLAGGQVNLAQLDRQGDTLITRGMLTNLPLAPVLDLLAGEKKITTDVRVDGDWNLRAGATLDGEAKLVRRSGDARLLDPALDFGLTTLALSARAEASRISASLAIETRAAGRAHAEGQATLERAGAGYSLPRAAPLRWNARVDVPDLRLAKAFLPVGIRADAQLHAAIDGSGSLAAPHLGGQIDASGIRFAMPEQGIAITDGTLKLALEDDRVRVQQGELKGAANDRGVAGRIVLSGEAQLKNSQAGLTATFEKFIVTNRSDRQITVSGVTRLKLDASRLELSGQLTADRARLEMPAADRPQLSSDVVIVGQPPRAVSASQRLPLALDLTLKLGDDFLFKGGGLDARLGGQLRVFTVNQALQGEGAIQVIKGRYAAYGQALDIQRGVLRFAGPVGNPGLDVLAVRKSAAVTAGVQVGGTVQRPIVKLYSDPALPDTDKLAWLVLGHGLENSGQEEYALLQVAAGALLSQAESVGFQSKLAETLRIDSVGVRAGNGESLATTVVSVGKRLSSRATLSYEQSLDGLSQVVKILYQLSPHVRLEAQAGQPNSFDAFYSLEFD